MKITTQNGVFVTETRTVYGQAKDIGIYALAQAADALYIQGVSKITASVRIVIPAYAYKSRIHTMEKHMKNACKEQNIELAETTSEQSSVLSHSMVIVTASGLLEEKEKPEVIPGQDILLVGAIGTEGMLRILSEKRSELEKRFAPSFLEQMKVYAEDLFIKEETEAAAGCVSVMREVSEGGILAALHRLSKEIGHGIACDLKKLTILQETVELCECFHLNPYQLASAGCMLLITSDGDALADALTLKGMKVSVIGKVTDNNDKILYNGEDVRYIDRPAPDEILKIYNGGN